MARVAIGDDEALLALYDRHGARVYGLALRMLHDAMSAEEITQDVFLKIKSRARSYSAQRGALIVWMLTITRNAVLDRIRYENRRPQLNDDDDPDEAWLKLADAASDTDEARWRSLAFALRSLEEERRKVIELAYYHGLSHSEIAEELQCPLGTVKTRLRLGMQDLRRIWLSPEADTDGDRSAGASGGV
jgi:RNA polymerase sigma-70 factor (ECF subfamily)